MDRVIQMVDGKIFRIIEGREEIDAMAAGGRFEGGKGEKRVDPVKEQGDRVIVLNRGVLAVGAGD